MVKGSLNNHFIKKIIILRVRVILVSIFFFKLKPYFLVFGSDLINRFISSVVSPILIPFSNFD